MMRLASFFILSVSLHATALVYPISFGQRSQAQLIQVTIPPIEQEGGGADGGRGNGMPARQGDPKSHRPAARITEPRVKPQSLTNPEPAGLPASSIETASHISIALPSVIANSIDSVPSSISNAAGDDPKGSDIGNTVKGEGLGSSGTGFGRGSGSGNGSGSSGVGIAVTHARYRDTPRPDYPDSARREGRAGRVLLRVLVDEQGRTKTVEITSSSGNEALDRAAAEAVRRWHFHPARYDDKAVESWLRIPIEFRLADAKSW